MHNRHVPKFRRSYLLSTAVVALGLVLVPGLFDHHQGPSVSNNLPTLLTTEAIPVLKASGEILGASDSAQELTEQLTAKAVFVWDVKSGSVLFDKNADTLSYPASTTKLMTALVAREAYDLNKVITITGQDQAEGTVIKLQPGEQLTVKELLQGTLIQSGNDAAQTLANHYQGGETKFIKAMNAKSAALHLDQTTFSNPTGIDEVHQQTTARDLAILAREIMKDEFLSQLVGTKATTIGSQVRHTIYNTHALLGRNGVVGMKTGTTDLAGEVLITWVKQGEQEILIVLMGSQNRYDETQAVLSWVMNEYTWRSAMELENYATR